MTEHAEFPWARRCPFDLPPELTARLDRPVEQVTIWNGTHPWLFTRFGDVRAVLGNDVSFSSDKGKPGYPLSSAAAASELATAPTLLVLDNPEHDAQRRLLTSEFTVKRAEAWRPVIKRMVDDRIDDLLAETPPVDFVSAFALPIALQAICELLGVPFADRDYFRKLSRTMGSVTVTTEEASAARVELQEYLVHLVRLKDEEPGDDLISRMVAKHLRQGRITAGDLAGQALLLLFAGHDTSANMISLGVAALLEHPDQFAALRDEPTPGFVANAVEELLRHLTVVQRGIRRIAVEDTEVNGHPVRAGEGVIAAINIANRDTSMFPQGDRLDLARRARHQLAFGYGIHQCLGQALARVLLQVVFGTVARRMPELRLAVSLGEVPFKYDMAVYGVHELLVTW